MRRVCILAKEFFKIPFFIVLLICTMLYLFSYSGDIYEAIELLETPFMRADSAISFTSSFLAACTYLGLSLFMIISYEFIRRTQTHFLNELFEAYEKQTSTLNAQLFFLGVLSLLFWIYICCLCFRIMRITQTIGAPITSNILLASVLYGFLPAVIGILLGAAGQRIGGRIGFYLFLFLFVFFSTQMSRDAYISLGGVFTEAGGLSLGVTVQKILDFWFRLPPVYNSISSTVYGIGIEPFHWALATLWCLLGGGVLLIFSHGDIRKVLGMVCFGAAIFCAFFVWHRGSNWPEYMVTPQERIAVQDSVYYSEDGTANNDEIANFRVTSYSMKLQIISELDADVTILMEGQGQENYTFTLYHGFIINYITDGCGNNMNYTQNGDYVTVNVPKDQEVSKLIFRYSGWHDSLFSTAQGIYLPGYFCYYPIPGRRTVYSNGQIVFAQKQPEPCNFSVSVRALCPLFSNLKEENKGLFCGNASTLTIIGGLYQERTINGIRYVLPWWMEYADYIEQLSQAIEELNIINNLDIPLPSYSVVFYSPSISLPTPPTGTCTSTQDALFVGHSYGGVQVSSLVSAYLKSYLSQYGEDNDLDIIQSLVEE